MPNDTVQAAALATAMRDAGCKRVGAVHDGETYGRGMSTLMRATAKRLGLRLTGTTRIRKSTRSYGAIKGDCIAYTGITANGATRMFNRVSRSAKLFASDGVAESAFTRHISASAAKRMTIAVSTLAPDAYGPAGAAIIGNGDPYKLYGYESMKLVLDGINAAGPSRAALLGWLRTGVQNRASVLGTYSLDANGDTTSRAYGLYGVSRKQLVWKGAVTAG
jgi:branched-chain amino acid transport system substrate-binding protein